MGTAALRGPGAGPGRGEMPQVPHGRTETQDQGPQAALPMFLPLISCIALNGFGFLS